MHAKADALVRKIQVRKLVRTGGVVNDKQQVDALGQLVANVRMGHKSTIAHDYALAPKTDKQIAAQENGQKA